MTSIQDHDYLVLVLMSGQVPRSSKQEFAHRAIVTSGKLSLGTVGFEKYAEVLKDAIESLDSQHHAMVKERDRTEKERDKRNEEAIRRLEDALAAITKRWNAGGVEEGEKSKGSVEKRLSAMEKEFRDLKADWKKEKAEKHVLAKKLADEKTERETLAKKLEGFRLERNHDREVSDPKRRQ